MLAFSQIWWQFLGLKVILSNANQIHIRNTVKFNLVRWKKIRRFPLFSILLNHQKNGILVTSNVDLTKKLWILSYLCRLGCGCTMTWMSGWAGRRPRGSGTLSLQKHLRSAWEIKQNVQEKLRLKHVLQKFDWEFRENLNFLWNSKLFQPNFLFREIKKCSFAGIVFFSFFWGCWCWNWCPYC